MHGRPLHGYVVPFLEWTGWNIIVLEGQNSAYQILLFPRRHTFLDPDECAAAEWLCEHGSYRENLPCNYNSAPLQVRRRVSRNGQSRVVVGPFHSLQMYDEFHHQVIERVQFQRQDTMEIPRVTSV